MDAIAHQLGGGLGVAQKTGQATPQGLQKPKGITLGLFPILLFLFLVFPLFRRRRSSFLSGLLLGNILGSGGDSWRGGGGGFGGGGFGGGGGGGFNGGGASGGW